MKINFQQVIKDLDGSNLHDDKFTLGFVWTQALLAPAPNGPSQSQAPGRDAGEHLAKLYTLAQRIHAAKAPLDISPEDAAMLRDRIGLMYNAAAVVGPVWAMLNG